MHDTSNTLLNETSDLLEELIPILDRNIQMLKNDIDSQGGALHFLLQKEIELQESLLQRSKELNESVKRQLKPQPPIRPPRQHVGDLTVIMEGGQEICHVRVSKTFVEVIEKIGVERVKNLDLILNGIPLIATYKHSTYSQTESGNYYITTHCNTTTKIERLKEIKRRLYLNFKVIDNRRR